MKRVLLIAPYPFLPYFSGGQKHIAQFAEYLGKESDLTVISTQKNDGTLAKGYTLLPWLPNPFYRYIDPRLYNRLCDLIRSERFDCIIWEHPYYYWLARAIRKKFGLYTIIHSHNIEYQRFRSTGKWWWPILRLYEGACLKMADVNFFISPVDQHAAIQEWKLNATRCEVLPLGIKQDKNPADRDESRRLIQNKHNIPTDARILLFNGLLNYEPNRQALDDLLQHINPLLQAEKEFDYKLIICGKNLPSSYNRLRAFEDKNIIYAGFVEDIETYFKAADVFLNPVQSGGGIKTKLIEAIGLGTTVVSSATGATGVDPSTCGNKLRIASNSDWQQFASLVIEEASSASETPKEYYQTYFWGNIIGRVTDRLAKQTAG